MRHCPGTNDLITIAEALEWKVAEGLEHLQGCEDCRAQLATLQGARAALVDTEPIDAATVERLASALRAEAERERARAQFAHRWMNATEVVLAGMTAVVVLVSSGIRIGSVVTLLFSFAIGGTLLALGRFLLGERGSASSADVVT